jgi:hypothetical protein
MIASRNSSTELLFTWSYNSYPYIFSNDGDSLGSPSTRLSSAFDAASNSSSLMASISSSILSNHC